MEYNKINVPRIKRSIKDDVSTEELENALIKVTEELGDLLEIPILEYDIPDYVIAKCKYDDLLDVYKLITDELRKRRNK